MTQLKAFFNVRDGRDMHSSIRGDVADTLIQSPAEFLQAGGYDYCVKRQPAYQAFEMDGERQFAEVHNQFHLVRSSDQAVVSASTVTSSYDPLSLVDIADELQGIVDEGWATPDAVYTARNGQLEMLTYRIDFQGDIDGENLQHYITVMNPHGAGKAVGGILTYRPTCANIFASFRHGGDFAITHRKARSAEGVAKARLARSVEIWDRLQKHIAGMAADIQMFKSFGVSRKEAEQLTAKLLGILGKGDKEISAQARNKRDRIINGFNLPAMGTNGQNLYDWFNAVTWMLSSPHANAKSKVSPTQRMVRTVDRQGTGFRLENRARQIALDMVS